MEKQLKIVITGGGTGIGAGLTQVLSQINHTIFICGRRVSSLKEVANV